MIINNLFSPFSICASAVSLFLSFLCPSIYGAAFERMFMSRCLCAIIRQCRITLSLHRSTPLRFFLLLNCNCNLRAEHCLVALVRSSRLALQVSFYFQWWSNSFLAMNRTLLLSCTRRVDIQRKIIK